MARLLVTNDDGVTSPGIIALADALRALGEVFVVAPESDRSGASHAISVHDAISVVEVSGRSVPTYACSGTPADCVILGLHQIAGGPVDFVVSGINRGANVADDINYSGTVAAAVEDFETAVLASLEGLRQDPVIVHPREVSPAVLH